MRIFASVWARGTDVHVAASFGSSLALAAVVAGCAGPPKECRWPDATAEEYAVYRAVLPYALKNGSGSVTLDPHAELRPVVVIDKSFGGEIEIWHYVDAGRACLRQLPPTMVATSGSPPSGLRRIALTRVTFDDRERKAYVGVSYQCEVAGEERNGLAEYRLVWRDGRWVVPQAVGASGHCP
jgi:hypothetical protein